MLRLWDFMVPEAEALNPGIPKQPKSRNRKTQTRSRATDAFSPPFESTGESAQVRFLSVSTSITTSIRNGVSYYRGLSN